MEKVTLDSLERYITLKNELAFEDPYVLKITISEFLEKHMEKLELGCMDIFILSNNKEDIGFIELSKDVDTATIEEIYVRKQYRNNNTYKSMLEFADKYYCNTNISGVKFITVNDKPDLIEALKDVDYEMEKEHIQMEKIISKLPKRSLTMEYRTFYEIGDEKWIYNFMKECMKDSFFNYRAEEVHELTHINSDLAFVLYEKDQPIGFMISYINEKRNKQENKNVVYIEEIAILKEFRNKGYGCKAIEFVLDKNNDMDIARLHVYRHNEIAYKLYKKLGFNEIKSIGYWVKDVKNNTMETIICEFNNNIKVYYTNQRKPLPAVYSEKVKRYWETLLSSGKSFFNGDVFTINKIEANESIMNIFVGLTDYAHFLYSINKSTYEDYDCRVIHTSVLIVTSDNKFAIGEMNEETAFPYKLQFIGGGIDKNDINGEVLDLEHNIKKEIREELGIDSEDKAIVRSLQPCFLKSGGEDNFLSAIFKMELLIDENSLRFLLKKHNETLESANKMQEIRSLIFIDATKEAVREFVAKDRRKKDGNLVATLEAAVGIRPVSAFNKCI